MSQTCEARVCVSYQHRLIFVYWGWMGAGGGVDVHITWLMNSSKHRWTLTCCRCWWSNQMLKSSNVLAGFLLLLIYLGELQRWPFPLLPFTSLQRWTRLFIYGGSLKLSTHLVSSARDQMARASWIYRPPFCRLRTDLSRSEIDNTCRPAVQPASLRSDETAAFIFSRVWAGLPLTGSHRKLFVLCKWWLMTRLAKPAVLDKKYWWLLSVKC